MSKFATAGDDFLRRLIKAGAIPQNCVSFQMIATIDSPVKFSYEVWATEGQCEAVTKTIEEIIAGE